MKINFDDIITKANARKDALIEFSKWVGALPDLLDQVNALVGEATKIKAAINALDGEARMLAGPEKVQAVEWFAGYVTNLNHQLLRRASYQKEPTIETLNKLIAEGN